MADRNRGGVAAVGGVTAIAEASFTRPSNTTAYAAGDVVSVTGGTPAVQEYECGRINGGSGVILDAWLIDSANVATKGSFELWLFDTEPTAVADNAAFAPTDAEMLTLVGVIPFTAAHVGLSGSGAAGNCVLRADKQNIAFDCAAASKTLYGVLVVRNAYVPVSAEVFKVRLNVLQD